VVVEVDRAFPTHHVVLEERVVMLVVFQNLRHCGGDHTSVLVPVEPDRIYRLTLVHKLLLQPEVTTAVAVVEEEEVFHYQMVLLPLLVQQLVDKVELL
jgi:hypothetical protein|tara:strand:- start:98 stop:391 length:294 start_codon:yes stop_codon:yes gene_type:complete